ncbi:MAG: glycosyltransferase family 2 protein [Candidatus Omnitrophota bacterium]|jgi:glycosyltransferase involved in cell wall biosynthesis
MKTCVVIPTYNEGKTISVLIDKIREQGLDVIIVDDGSTDNTAKIAQDKGVALIRNENNQGKGASLIKGFNYALDKGFDAVICMDGDGQHLPEEIPSFIRFAEHSSNSVFVGNRMTNLKGMPLVRMLTNKFMSWLISLVAKQKIYDTQCGFRLIKSEVLKRVSLKAAKFEIESELLIQASRLGFGIESVPIKTVYAGEKSQINPFFDTLRFIQFIFKELKRK